MARFVAAFAIRHLSSAIRHPPSAICHLPSAICHLPSAIRHPPFVICHPPFVICHLSSAISPSPFPVPNSAFRIFSRAEQATQSLAQRKRGWPLSARPLSTRVGPFRLSFSTPLLSPPVRSLHFTGHWPQTTVLPLLAPQAAARRDQRGQVVRRRCPAGYCLTPTAEFPKSERDPISTSGPRNSPKQLGMVFPELQSHQHPCTDKPPSLSQLAARRRQM